MKFRLLTLAALCALALALLFTMTPLVAQTATDKPQASASDNNSMIPGTGMTMAELRDLGWSPAEVADMQSPASDQNASANSEKPGAGSQNEPANSDKQSAAGNNDTQKAGTTGTAAGKIGGGGGGGWGLWGLVGLLGLLGLGGRSRRSEVVRDDRDIRRVA